MKLWMSIFLGFIQGLTEFLPISSSGHLAIFQNLFKMELEHGMFFEVLLHLATLISVCIVYRQEILDIIRGLLGFFKKTETNTQREQQHPAVRLLLLIIVATLPLLVVMPFKSKIEALSDNTYFIGFALLITGAVLFLSDKLVPGRKTEKNAGIKDALAVGVAQAVAIVPGLSRSGTTISVGITQGLNREFAVKFSFLLSIPAVLGALILKIFDAVKEGIDTSLLPTYLVGMVVAGVSGYFAIRFVKTLTQKGKFSKFAYYCWGVGLLTIVLSIIL